MGRPKFENLGQVSSESSGARLTWAGESHVLVLFVLPRNPCTTSKKWAQAMRASSVTEDLEWYFAPTYLKLSSCGTSRFGGHGHLTMLCERLKAYSKCQAVDSREKAGDGKRLPKGPCRYMGYTWASK